MLFRSLKKMGKVDDLAADAPTIGIPWSLTLYTYRPLWERFFGKLGYKVDFGKPTDAKVAREGVELVAGDFCYPVQISTGHVAKMLKDDNVPWVFVPMMVAQKEMDNLPHRQFCPWVQSHSAVLRSNMKAADLDVRKMIDTPIDFRVPERTVVRNLNRKLGNRLGVSKSQIRSAWRDALKVQEQFDGKCQEEGKKALDEIHRSGEKAIVVIGRPYNTFDMGSNLSLPRKFAQYNYRVIPVDFMPFSETSVPEEYRSVFWAYGQRILSALETVRKDEQLFAVYFSNFSCGPDSFILSYAEQLMGNKPMLVLTLDEHGADTGYLTRLEAFLDVIAFNKTPVQHNPLYFPRADSAEFRKRTIWIPPMHPYGTPIFAAAFTAYGWKAEALPEESYEAFELGREYTRGDECLPDRKSVV